MLKLIESVRTAARNRLAYHRTVAELSALPQDALLDLDIYSGDIRRIAHDAVYGQSPSAPPAHRSKAARFRATSAHA